MWIASPVVVGTDLDANPRIQGRASGMVNGALFLAEITIHGAGYG